MTIKNKKNRRNMGKKSNNPSRKAAKKKGKNAKRAGTRQASAMQKRQRLSKSRLIEDMSIIDFNENQTRLRKKEIYRIHKKNIDNFIYWFSLVILFILNLLSAIALVPFFIVLNNSYIYMLTAIIGITFGALFNFITLGIETLSIKNHIFAMIFIPLVSIINISIIMKFSRALSSTILKNSTITYNISIVIIIFAFSFIMPYLVSVIRGKYELSSISAHD